MEATRSDSPILPQELIAEVLCRLPVKSLCRFKSVSHSWYSLISDPRFAQTHFTQTTNKMPNRLILISDFHTLFSVDYSAQIPVATELNFPSVEDESYAVWSGILGSCNGLVLALNEYDFDKYFLNPLTRESKKIPESPFAIDLVKAYNPCGLGYDSITDDYKVVMLSYYGGGVDEESGATTETNTIVSVYSLKSDSWRKIQGSSYLHCAADPPGVYLNGCVHWLAQRGSDYFSVIVAFDFGNETFREFLPPPFVNNAVFLDEYNNAVSPWFHPAVLGGYLCFQAFTDVWVMKEYGKKESWTKFTIGKPDDISRIELVDLLEDGEFLFSRDEEQLVVYNSKDETSRDMVVCGIPGIFTSGGTYVESLISPERIHGIGRECEAWERMKSTEMEHSQSPSTPSRHLRKRGGKQSQPQSAHVHKANWDSDTVRMFLQLVIKELDLGFKGSFHTMTMHGYRAVAKAFEERTHKVHDVKQLQNKYASLKKDWQSWSRLMDSRHGPTGISYNETTGLIQASDDWWAHYEKIDKNALKFKTKPLEHMELMRRVYEGATAIGKFAWTPGAAFEPVATEDNPLLVDEEDCEDSSGLPPFQPSAQHGQTFHHSSAQEDTPVSVHAAASAIHADDTPTSGWSKRKFSRTTHSQRKKGQCVGASLLASSMENLASSVKLQQREVRVYHEYGDSASDCIRKCMARLYSLQGLDRQDPLILYGMTLMDNPTNQAILLQLPTDADVITWLRMKKSQNMGGPSAPTHGPWF